MTSTQPRRPEVRSDLRFEIYGPNFIYYHVCLDCLDLLLNFVRKKERKKKDNSILLELLGFAATKNQIARHPTQELFRIVRSRCYPEPPMGL